MIQTNRNKPPVITIMGHVDHGKTSLLDYILSTNVASKEAGAITQHTSAYQIELGEGKDARKLTFIDTPGHEAFSAMRMRGGKVADIVVLVVSASEGVKEQTKEAIMHAKSSGAVIIIALNKMDLPSANPDKVKEQLSQAGLLVENWGGDITCVEVSAKTGDGVPELLELLMLQADLMELPLVIDGNLEAMVIESHLDAKSGSSATIVVRQGTLKSTDVIYAEGNETKIRSLRDFKGKDIKEALPGDVAIILGLKQTIKSGSIVTHDMELSLLDYSQKQKVLLTEDDTQKNIRLIIKADSFGTLEAIEASIYKLGSENIEIQVVSSGVGSVSDSDVLLAQSSGALVVSFHLPISKSQRDLAKELKVETVEFDLIYKLIEDIEERITGICKKEEFKGKGRIEILETFKLPSGDIIFGCLVTDGQVRDGNKLLLPEVEGQPREKVTIKNMKLRKESIEKAHAGMECGILLKPQPELKRGDILEVV